MNSPQTFDEILTQVVATHEQAHLSPEPVDTFAAVLVQALEGLTVAGVCPYDGAYQGQLSVHQAAAETAEAAFHVALTDPVTGRQQWLTERGLEDLEKGRA